MATNLSKYELDVLLKADDELYASGHTEQKCPRCGNEIICETKGNSYTVRCKTENCIKTDFRGI